MKEITTLEKVIVNILTPADYVLSPFFGAINYEGEVIDRGFFEYKIKSYARLIRLLELNPSSKNKIAAPYMEDLCGRVQVRLAVRRGLIEKGDYKTLARKHPLNLSLR